MSLSVRRSPGRLAKQPSRPSFRVGRIFQLSKRELSSFFLARAFDLSFKKGEGILSVSATEGAAGSPFLSLRKEILLLLLR